MTTLLDVFRESRAMMRARRAIMGKESKNAENRSREMERKRDSIQ